MSMRRGRPEAADVVWRWRERPGVERDRIARLRRGGAVRAVAAGIVGGVLMWLDRPMLAAVALTLAMVTLVLAILSPGVGYARMERVVDRVASGVGAVVAFVLLAPVYFLFFVPFRMIARRGQRDRLRRRFERDRQTYWIRRESDEPRLEKPY